MGFNSAFKELNLQGDKDTHVDFFPAKPQGNGPFKSFVINGKMKIDSELYSKITLWTKNMRQGPRAGLV
jgi:hypothetical protein